MGLRLRDEMIESILFAGGSFDRLFRPPPTDQLLGSEPVARCQKNARKCQTPQVLSLKPMIGTMEVMEIEFLWNFQTILGCGW